MNISIYYIKTSDMDKLAEKTFYTTIDNYKIMEDNIEYIYNDIKNLDILHNKFTKNKDIINNKDILSRDLCIYLDDIHFQKKNLEIEYNALKTIYEFSLEKYYRDLFKIYTKIINILTSILLENKDIVVNIFDIKQEVQITKKELKIFKKKMMYIIEEFKKDNKNNNIDLVIKSRNFNLIKLYNDVNNSNDITRNDITNIFINIYEKLDELNISSILIKYHIKNTKNNITKGVMGNSYLINKNGYYDKINIECDTIKNFINNIITNHINISEKYKNRSSTIANEILYRDNTDYLNINNLLSSSQSDSFKDDNNNENTSDDQFMIPS
jgi:hypothetical protein